MLFKFLKKFLKKILHVVSLKILRYSCFSKGYIINFSFGFIVTILQRFFRKKNPGIPSEILSDYTSRFLEFLQEYLKSFFVHSFEKKFFFQEISFGNAFQICFKFLLLNFSSKILRGEGSSNIFQEIH